MHSGIFAPLTRLLIKKFRVHCVDLPGHGYNRDSTESLVLADCAARIAEITPPAIWIGWSLGGLISLEAALQRHPKVQGIISIASSPRFVAAEDWPYGVLHKIFVQFGTGLLNDYYRTIDMFLMLEVQGTEDVRAELRELKAHVFDRGEPALHVLEEGLKILDQTDMRSKLSELQIPSLWIAGRRDRLVSPQAMRWAAEQSPGGRYLEISAGHAPFISHAERIAQAISEFADEIVER